MKRRAQRFARVPVYIRRHRARAPVILVSMRAHKKERAPSFFSAIYYSYSASLYPYHYWYYLLQCALVLTTTVFAAHIAQPNATVYDRSSASNTAVVFSP
jgi:hypothetical protein